MSPLRFTRPLLLAGLAGCLTATSGCDSEPTDPNPQELITQVRLTLTNTDDAANVVTITASDPDGDGAGITFTPMSAPLRPGATYTGTITLDDTINGESITEEIEAEADEHLFRYAFAPASAGTVTLTDRESDYGGSRDLPVGLAFRAEVAASATGSGALNAILYHFDEEPKTSGTATSDEIDVDIDFPVTFVGPAVAGAGTGR